jgi:hypothetical protein
MLFRSYGFEIVIIFIGRKRFLLPLRCGGLRDPCDLFIQNELQAPGDIIAEVTINPHTGITIAVPFASQVRARALSARICLQDLPYACDDFYESFLRRFHFTSSPYFI